MKQRGTLTLSGFRGVDFSHSPLEVKPTRAADMVNFYQDEGGRTRKRPGWRERLCIRDENDTPQVINGIFSYEDGERRDVIVHAGCRFYRLITDENGRESVEDITESGTYEPSHVDASRLISARSQAFYMGRRMYIIGCGDYLVYGSWNDGESYELRRVWEDEDTYIPTTTVGIDGEHYNQIYAKQDDNGEIHWVFHGDGYEHTPGTRESHDDVNLLTRWRENKLQGIKGSYYQLDASIDEGTEIEVINDMTGEVFVPVTDRATWGEPVTEFCKKNKKALIKKSDLGMAQPEYHGYVYLNIAYVELMSTGFPTDNGDSLITVRFRHTPTADEAGVKVEDFVPYEDRVTRCSFGITYGIDGNTDRIFLSGNPSFGNVDFFSEADDATYFSDLNTVAMGTNAQAVVGYARLSDNTLAVFKEHGGGSDASIFYRTGYYKEEVDDAGNLARILPIFPTTAGNIGETVVSRNACLDFGGDSLILSRNGVFGIVLSENISTADRYTRERSRSVNARLCKETGLDDAVALSYNNRYYLAVGGHCYVADARMKYYADKDADGSYQYEWWFWDNIPAHVFAELDGKLYFGTEDGRLCVFDGEHTDRTYTECEAGELAVDIVNNQIDCAMTLTPRDGERVILDTAGLYALYAGSIRQIKGERIYVDEERILGMSDGTVVYADGEGLDAHVPYVVDDVDVASCSFRLLDTGGEAVAPISPDFRLHVELTGQELVVCEATPADFRLKLWEGGEVLVLTAYDGEVPSSPVGRLIHRKTVKAAWITPVFDLGSAAHLKTLLSMTMTAEPGVPSGMSFGYQTRRDAQMHELRGARRAFSLDDLSFREFAFDTGFAQSDTRRVFERGFNYIAFRFASDTDDDCAIGAFSAIYKINGYQGGVK